MSTSYIEARGLLIPVGHNMFSVLSEMSNIDCVS